MNQIKSLFLPGKSRGSYADAGDFLRVACVGMIGWYHIWQQSWLNPNLNLFGRTVRLYPLVSCGYMFVDLMLLLSGFLLMLGWESGRDRRARDFYASRAARILPSYWLCLAVMLALTFLLPGNAYSSAGKMWEDLLSHLSFTHNLFPETYRSTKLNGALWTLAVEVQFYLIFPPLARAFKRSPACTYCAMVALGMCSRALLAIFMPDTTLYVNRLLPMLDVYANGMLAAHIYKRLCKRPQRAASAHLNTALAIAALVAIVRILVAQSGRSGGENLRLGQMLWRFPLSAAGCAFLICGSRSILLLRRMLSNRLIRFLSGLSFNFYIWHQVLAVWLKEMRIPYYAVQNPNQLGLQPWQNRYTFCCFFAALILSLLITYLVEKPCARWIKRRRTTAKALETPPQKC